MLNYMTVNLFSLVTLLTSLSLNSNFVHVKACCENKAFYVLKGFVSFECVCVEH